MKVTVVGAGNVGATCADVLAYREIANQIVLVDIKEGLAEGKSLDIWQKAGARVDHSRQHVWLDRGLVMELIARAPASFTDVPTETCGRVY